MWFKLSQIILRNRILIISIIVGLTVLFGYYAFTGLETDNKYGNTLPKNSPAQNQYLKFKEMFGENEGILVLAVKTNNLYTESNFLKWRSLTDTISKFEGVISVFSEADLFTINNNTEKQKFEANPIFSDKTFSQKSIEEIREEIRRTPLYDGLLYNDSASVSLMLISFDEEVLSDMKRSKVVIEVEELARTYEQHLGEMHFAGLPHIRVVMGERIINEMYIFIGLAIFVTSLLLYVFFRSVRVVLFCNAVVFTSVIWSLGSIAMLGFEISILMALIPPLIIVIGIPDCVYLLMKFHQEVKDHGNKIKALSRVIQKVGNATFMTNFTTAVGFSTFIFVNSEKLKEFGLVSSLNIMAVFVLSITIIPILFSLTKQPKKRHLKHLDKKFAVSITHKLIRVTTGYRKTIYIITAIVVALSIVGAVQLKATGNLTSDLPESDPILKDIKFIEENFNGAIPFEILINYKKDARKFDKSLLEKLELAQYKLEKDSVFSKPLSVVDFMKLINMAYYGNNPDKYQLIERRDLLRLKNYVDAFQQDMAQIKLAHSFQDSIKKGKRNYADSILLNFPNVAATIMSYEPKTIKNDTLSPQKIYPSNKEIQNFLSEKDYTEQIVVSTEQIYPNVATGLSLKELVDTANTTYRIRLQVLDLGSYEMLDKIDDVSKMLDTVLNPKHEKALFYLSEFKKNKFSYADSIFSLSGAYKNNLSYYLAGGNDSLIYKFDLNPDLLLSYYENESFLNALEKAIDEEKLEYFITGVSAVAAEGTQYLVSNLISSIIFAIISISFIMALLFFSWKMILISMIPNFIPLIITAGVMGFTGIPIKPSTLLIFSIAFGISIDDTIHFLSRYRREMKTKSYNQKACIINSLYETGMSMFYTSIILLCGFSMFAFSQFGGTQALGLLISLTLLVAMLTNLLVVPSLLFSLEKNIAEKAFFKEPFITIYDEDLDIDLSELKIDPKTRVDYVETDEK